MIDPIYIKTQSPAFFKSLRFSFGIATSKTTQRHARQLAPTVKAIKPGVFMVGASICDLWRMSCSCQAARQRKLKGISQAAHPCPHFVALYLSLDWNPSDSNPTAYLKSVGVEQPQIIAIYARIKNPENHWQTVRLEKVNGLNAGLIARPLNDPESFFLVWPESSEIKRLQVMYE